MGRTLELMNYYKTMLGLLRAKSGHPGVHFRYVIGPSEDIASKTIPIDFDSNDTDYLINLGERDATAAITDLKSNRIDEMVQTFVNKEYYNPVRQARHLAAQKKALEISQWLNITY